MSHAEFPCERETTTSREMAELRLRDLETLEDFMDVLRYFPRHPTTSDRERLRSAAKAALRVIVEYV